MRYGLCLRVARRRGAMPVGVDVAEAQLESARLLQNQFDVHFPLVRASADEVPFADESFDFVISEYGASTWLDPSRWVAEASRLLRPGGQLVFVVNGTMLMTCTPEDGVEAGTELVRDYFGMSRCEFPEDGTVEYHLGYGDWVRTLRAHGFVVEDLIEVRPPEGRRQEGTTSSRSTGRADGPAKRCGRLVSSAERMLVLASTSPQRRAILEQLRIPFEVVAPGLRRTREPDVRPRAARTRPCGGEGALGSR